MKFDLISLLYVRLISKSVKSLFPNLWCRKHDGLQTCFLLIPINTIFWMWLCAGLCAMWTYSMQGHEFDWTCPFLQFLHTVNFCIKNWNLSKQCHIQVQAQASCYSNHTFTYDQNEQVFFWGIGARQINNSAINLYIPSSTRSLPRISCYGLF